MRVLHVIARLNVGGTARWLETLTAEQAAAGQDVLVAAGYVQAGEIEDDAASTLPLVRLGRLGRAVSPLDDLISIRELRDLINEWQPDVVNTHTAKAGFVGRAAALSLGSRRPALVHTVHGHLLTGYFSGLALRSVIVAERMLANASDLLLAVGDRVRKDLIIAGVVAPDKVLVVRPGVADVARLPVAEARMKLGLSGDPSQPMVGWLGRVARVKRPDRLLGVASATPAVDYLVGGGGPLSQGLQERATANMRVLGWVDPSTFWSACDLAVLTSDNEGMPTSIIEAALAGLPAVTTDVGSAPEVVVDGVTGLVVEPTAQAVARAVSDLTSDPVAMRAMGAAARIRSLQEFSPQQMLAEHTWAYQRAQGARR